MALACTGNLKIQTQVSETLTSELSSGTVSGSSTYNKTWAAGSGADSINEYFTWDATLAISTPVTHVLSNLTDGLGRTIVFTKVREFYLKNNGLGTLTIGGAASFPWAAIVGDAATDKIKIPPGGILILVAPDATGFAVGAGSADQLKLDPGATACPYELIILGA